MCTSSTTTVGMVSATSVLPPRVPEEQEPAGAEEQRPPGGEQPDVWRKLVAGEAVDQREPHQVDVDGRRVRAQEYVDDVGDAVAAGDLVDAPHHARDVHP